MRLGANLTISRVSADINSVREIRAEKGKYAVID